MTRRHAGQAGHSSNPDAFELLLIDGNNLLHRLSGGVDEVAQRNLLSRLRGLFEPPARVVLVLDGQPAPGSPRQLRISANLDVRQAGDADRALLALIEERPFHARAATVLVSDDRALTERARRLGAGTRRLAWLLGLLDRSPGRTVAGGRPARSGPRAAEAAGDEGEADEREGWRPGRGATRKKGNPRRNPRRR